MRLKNKDVLITGAGGLLGSALAQSFIKEGANIWLADSDKDSLFKSSKELPKEKILGQLTLDVSSPEQVNEAFAKIKKERGALDVLINNAGIGVFDPFWERDFKDFMNVMAVNAGGTFLCTKEALNIMKVGGGGSIVNIGSVYGVVSSDPSIYTDCSRMNSEAYSASKAAVIQLTKYFSVHAIQNNVRVNCVSPGGIFNEQGEDFIKNYSSKTPMGRMAEYEEITGAITFLSSDEASYINGQNLVIDGGLTAW